MGGVRRKSSIVAELAFIPDKLCGTMHGTERCSRGSNFSLLINKPSGSQLKLTHLSSKSPQRLIGNAWRQRDTVVCLVAFKQQPARNQKVFDNIVIGVFCSSQRSSTSPLEKRTALLPQKAIQPLASLYGLINSNELPSVLLIVPPKF